MKTTDTLLAFLCLCGSASAATITQTKNFSFTPTANQTLSFDRFDTMGGTRTLNSVTFTTSLTKSGGSLYVDNDSPSPASGSITQTVTINLSSTDLFLINSLGNGVIGSNISAVSSYAVSLLADDGDGVGYQSGGPDWGGTTFSDVTSGETMAAGIISNYIGSTSYAIKVSGAQSTDTTAVSGSSGAFSPATAAGFVSVTYDYTSLVPVPEPESWMLVCAGIGGSVFFRRRSI